VRRAGLEAVGVAVAGWYRWKEEIRGYPMVVVRICGSGCGGCRVALKTGQYFLTFFNI
jgi:hypothetical protein